MTIYARIADLHDQLAATYRELDEEQRRAPQAEPRRWVKLKEFCELAELGESTVRGYIQSGMPVKMMGPRNLRINIEGAMAWLEAQGIANRRRGVS